MLSQYSLTTKEEKDNATHEVMQEKTSFSPNFKNKTTSVAIELSYTPNLITSLKKQIYESRIQ
jgi:hypothetical protein